MRFLGYFLLLFIIMFIMDGILKYLGYNTNEGSVRMGRYFISLLITCVVVFLFAILRDKLTANKKDPDPNTAGKKGRHRSRQQQK